MVKAHCGLLLAPIILVSGHHIQSLVEASLGSNNYTSLFFLRSSAAQKDIASINAACDASLFCSGKPRGQYCYRPTNSSSDQSGKSENCMPVTIIICPEALLVECSDGFSCREVVDPWPNEITPEQRASFGFQPVPLMQDMESMPAARCLAVPGRSQPKSMIPSERGEFAQWCQKSKINSACKSMAIQTKKLVTSKPTISTIWWWPGMETGAPPTKVRTTESTITYDTCLSTRLIPTCDRRYPFTTAPATSYLFISVSTTSVPTTRFISQPASTVVSTATMTVNSFSTVFQTTTAQIQAPTIPAQKVPEIVSAKIPATKLPPCTTETIMPSLAKATESSPTTMITATGKIPQVAFPQAGEPYDVYTAKLAAIATVG